MQAALARKPALAAGESPVSVLAPETGPATGGEVVPGSAQVMVIRTPAERLIWLRALPSRRHAGITGLLAFFAGFWVHVSRSLGVASVPASPRKRIWQMPGAIAAGVSSCGQAPLSIWAIPQPALILPAQGQT
jgi:hypothetical protein